MPELTYYKSGKVDQTSLPRNKYFQNIFIFRNTAQIYSRLLVVNVEGPGPELPKSGLTPLPRSFRKFNSNMQAFERV